MHLIGSLFHLNFTFENVKYSWILLSLILISKYFQIRFEILNIYPHNLKFHHPTKIVIEEIYIDEDFHIENQMMRSKEFNSKITKMSKYIR